MEQHDPNCMCGIENFREKLTEDLRLALEQEDCSNEDIAQRLWNKLNEKHASIMFEVLVYDETVGFDKHTIGGGFYVNIFRHHGRCGVVFYAHSPRPIHPRRKEAQLLVSQIVRGKVPSNPFIDTNALVCYERVRDTLPKQGIVTCRIAVIRRLVGLKAVHANEEIIFEIGSKFIVMVFL